MSADALGALTAALGEVYGNASSIHTPGQTARRRLERARGEVAALLGCDSREVVFTSGGTESDNLAILGVVRRGSAQGKHVVTTSIEHPAVLASCEQAEREGAEVTWVSPRSNGVVHAADVRAALRGNTVLVSVMHANNETGAVQQVAEIAATARELGILVHSDGVQAAGKPRVGVAELGVDLYSISGHKLNAPKGIGALYVRQGVKLQAQMFGGRHERERRAGTENVPSAVALGAAAAWHLAHGDAECGRLAALRDRLEAGILARVPGVRVNGAGAARLPNTSNLRFDGIEGEALVIALDLAGFAVSTGAACSSGAVQPSHVLTAMGLTAAEARSSLRFSLGLGNDEAQVDALVAAVEAAVARLRRLSPVYSHAG
ncbi:MAG: cysteine desulfurase [Bryobacterales bacterium]|nr:cysteine desulfurase [Bryobacterales bacterium]